MVPQHAPHISRAVFAYVSATSLSLLFCLSKSQAVVHPVSPDAAVGAPGWTAVDQEQSARYSISEPAVSLPATQVVFYMTSPTLKCGLSPILKCGLSPNPSDCNCWVKVLVSMVFWLTACCCCIMEGTMCDVEYTLWLLLSQGPTWH
jgi:hypothetical protein